jgi:hypothetical protein
VPLTAAFRVARFTAVAAMANRAAELLAAGA